MKPNLRQWLGDALESAEILHRHIGDIDSETFQQDAWIRGAVERRLKIIGEALRRSRDENPELFDRKPLLHEWIALRNFIAHQYDGIDELAIWTAATVELEELVVTLRTLLDSPSSSETRC